MKLKYVSFILLIICMIAHSKTVIDQRNIAVEIPDQVSRIISITIPMASMLITIDQSTERLTGINRASHSDFVDGFLPKIYPEVATIPYNIAGDGFVPNVETLANLRPDVVIQWGDMGNHIIKPIQDAGFPVVTTIYGETIYVADWMRIIGEITGKTQRANQLAENFIKEYNQLKSKNQFPASEKPKVIYLHNYSTGLVAAGNNNSFQGDIEVAGGINVASGIHGISPINIEQLILWDPQIILLSTFENNLTPELLYNDARLKNIDAIKNKRVYSYPRGGFRWDPPSQESILALTWLTQLFHPQSSGKQFRQQMQQAYKILYDYQINDEDIDKILRIKDNQSSANYCQLFCR